MKTATKNGRSTGGAGKSQKPTSKSQLEVGGCDLGLTSAASQPAPDNGEDLGRLIPVDRVGLWPGNPREDELDETELEGLAASIRAKGVLQALLVRPWPEEDTSWRGNPPRARPAYQIAAGERRWRAAQLAGLKVVPCRVLALADRDMLEIAVIENEQRADLSPLRKARGYQRLIEEHGHTVETIAEKVGKSASTVRGLLKLVELPPAAAQALTAGELSVSVAQVVARIPTPAAREEATALILQGTDRWDCNAGRNVTEPLTHRAAKALVEQHFSVELKGAPFDRRALDLVLEAGSCTDCPKRVGNLQKSDPDGYTGIRADVCTDPECYRRKVKAWQDGVMAAAEAKGQTVLSEKEAAKVFPYGDSLAHDAPYFDLAESCYEDGRRKGAKGKCRSYGQLLEGHVQDSDFALAYDKRGGLHRLVPKDRALPVLRKQHGLFKERSYGDEQRSRTTDEAAAEKRKRLAAGRLRRETDRAVLQQAHDAARRLFEAAVDGAMVGYSLDCLAVLRCLAHDAAGHAYGSTGEEICRRRGLKVQHVADQRQEIGRLIAAADAPGLLALVTEFVAGRGLIGWGHGAAGRDLAGALGIDRRAVEKATRARLAEAKGAKGRKAEPVPVAAAERRTGDPEHAALGLRVHARVRNAEVPSDDNLGTVIALRQSGVEGVAGDVTVEWDLRPGQRRPLRTHSRPEALQVVALPPRPPITRDALLADLLTGPGTTPLVYVLAADGLHDVEDLLTRAASHPHGVGLVQQVCGLLREVLGDNAAGQQTAYALGDALVDAGLIGAGAQGGTPDGR
jgi:ParB/RepB/Spo0J family partition protein